MSSYLFQFVAIIFFSMTMACGSVGTSAKPGAESAPAPSVAEKQNNAPVKGEQTAVFAGGCFWGVEAVFERIKGVTDSRSGYAGGAADTTKYDLVSMGDTGHAESVEVKFDPEQISYEQ